MIKYTQEQIDNRTSDYVCWDCGKPFISINQSFRAVTAHTANCGLCGENKSVTHIREWNWLRLPKITEK